MNNILEIEGVLLPAPSSVQHGIFDLTDAKRNANGKMIIQYIRKDIHKIECSWNLLTPDEFMVIQNATSKGADLNTTFYIPDLNMNGTIQTYRGDRTLPIYTYEKGRPVYKGFKCNFIEM